MAFLGRRGQSFDVFKLLISAVVAIAILSILFGILGGIFFGVQKKPHEQALSKVKDSINNIGILQFTEAVTFSNGDSLDARNIALGTQTLAEDRVCVSKGDFEDEEAFNEARENELIIYQGLSRRTTKLAVICDYGNALEDTIDKYGKDWSVDACGCADTDASNTDRCCFVAIARNT